MAKKIAVRLALIVITGAVLFALTYLISYRLTANKYNTEAMATTAAPAEETTAEEAITEAPVTAEPEETEPPVPYDATRLADPKTLDMPEDDTWSLVLINQFYKLRADYEPFVEQVMEDSAIYLDRRVAEAFRTMYDAALADGIELTLSAGYITPDRQSRLFEKQVKIYTDQGVPEEEAKARAAFFVLPAGCS